ncbi:MAG: hypothetical protein Q8865_10805, partial [Bacillota bacterium]|nr:hypothetical protein [Bacillota bacterium]
RIFFKSHAKELVYEYPVNKKKIAQIEGDHILFDGQPKSPVSSRTTDEKEMQLVSDERYIFLQNSVRAVDAAVDVTKSRKDGDERMKLIKSVYWDKTRTLYGAALNIPISERQAQRWNTEFLEIISKRMGWV